MTLVNPSNLLILHRLESNINVLGLLFLPQPLFHTVQPPIPLCSYHPCVKAMENTAQDPQGPENLQINANSRWWRLFYLLYCNYDHIRATTLFTSKKPNDNRYIDTCTHYIHEEDDTYVVHLSKKHALAIGMSLQSQLFSWHRLPTQLQDVSAIISIIASTSRTAYSPKNHQFS
jgi:hypothetical protein